MGTTLLDDVMAELAAMSGVVAGEGGIVTPRVWYCRWCYASWHNDTKEIAALHRPGCLRQRAMDYVSRSTLGRTQEAQGK